jgi:hypothetical protein
LQSSSCGMSCTGAERSSRRPHHPLTAATRGRYPQGSVDRSPGTNHSQRHQQPAQPAADAPQHCCRTR